MANVSEMSKGSVIKWKDDLWVINEFQHVSPGKGSAFTRIKLKNISTGKTVENTFKATEQLEFADVQRKTMQYLYGDKDGATFMDMVSYEQVVIGNDILGEERKYLLEGLQVSVSMYNDQAIAIALPKKVEYVVEQTQPAVKGDTASGNVQKDAVMTNGLLVRVPIFIKEGDKLLINTDTCEYSERVK
ncbi:TPA: elongation factor P [Candidatus Uhrbacteria bacterium]|nr:elongation factor P [Candidatus Uhrbacteria bacterium]